MSGLLFFCRWFLARGSWGGGGFAAVNNYAGGALFCCGFGSFVRFIFFIIQFGEVVFRYENIGLLTAQTTTDTACLAHRTRGLSVFTAGTTDG